MSLDYTDKISYPMCIPSTTMAPNSLNISVTCPSKVVDAARELGKPKEGLRG